MKTSDAAAAAATNILAGQVPRQDGHSVHGFLCMSTPRIERGLIVQVVLRVKVLFGRSFFKRCRLRPDACPLSSSTVHQDCLVGAPRCRFQQNG